MGKDAAGRKQQLQKSTSGSKEFEVTAGVPLSVLGLLLWNTMCSYFKIPGYYVRNAMHPTDRIGGGIVRSGIKYSAPVHLDWSDTSAYF